MDEKFLETAGDLERAEVEAARRRIEELKQERPLEFDGICECGEEVPPARVQHGFFNCVSCQQSLEQRRKQFRV